jgi:dipeptidase
MPKLLVKDRKGNLVQSPVVSPWMSGNMQNLLNSLKPGSAPTHYTIANNTTSYSTVIQCRSWLPDPIGGIVWLGFDNPAQTVSAAWAFRRAARLAQLGWGKTRKMVEGLINEIEDRAFTEIPLIEKNAVESYGRDPDKARAFITAYCRDFALAVTQRYWDLGDELWDLFTTYDFFLTTEERKKWR